MLKRVVLGCLVLGGVFLAGCAPVKITKCKIEYKYENGQKVMEYSECIEQVPEKMPPIHLKNVELYE